MKGKKALLESLGNKLGDQIDVRRYSLSDMISESYKALYNCESGTNLYKLVESHLDDVRKNPKDVDRLSRQLSIIKQISRMVESNELKDEDLVPEEAHDEVDPKEDRAQGLKESAAPYTWGDWQHERGSICRVKFYSSGTDLTNQVIGVVYEKTPEQPYYGAEIYDNSTASTIEDRADDSYHFDTEKEAIEWVEEWFSKEMHESKDDEDLVDKEKYDTVKPKKERILSDTVEESKDENGNLKRCDQCNRLLDDSGECPTCDHGEEDLEEDTELTEEEVEELAKHLEEIRKEHKAAAITPASQNEACDEKTDECDSAPVKEAMKARRLKRSNENKGVIPENKTYESLNLSEFSKKSYSKAFVKTFKKLQGKLKEGTALTRQESIALYKAANSAMTHLSVELEHNPEFLDTFKESVSLLSVDVDKVLGSLKEGKAPSKATMKSLAKFSEALLREEDEIDDTPIEDEDDDIISNEEIENESEEAEEFDQEYADARVELHKELADEHADSENPEVQEKLDQDAAEVLDLPGITDDQVAEITGEEPEAEAEEETSEEEEEVEESKEDKDLDLGADDDITDDELAELKKHLKEMRSAKRK